MSLTAPAKDGFAPMSIREFTFQEPDKIDMRAWGNIIYTRAKILSKRVNNELLAPVSEWIDDPAWMKKFQKIEDHVPKWWAYKRNHRHRIKRLKILAQERLRNYWQEIKRRRNYRNEISGLNNRAPPRANLEMEIGENFLSPIISPFSPPEQRKAETIIQFNQVRRISISNLLPWKLLISSELSEVISFNNLKTYCSESQDRVSKLIHLLHMETEGKVKLIQREHFGEITIEPLDIDGDQKIKIKDQQTREYVFPWTNLSDNQRSKIIADIKDYKILCKTV
jgi:hypothetical protein